MNPKKYRWSKVYESAEEELQELLAAKQIEATHHEVESYDSTTLASRDDITRLWGAEGTAIVMVDATRFSLQPGDVLDIPPHAITTITTGLSNFTWYESYVPVKA